MRSGSVLSMTLNYYINVKEVTAMRCDMCPFYVNYKPSDELYYNNACTMFGMTNFQEEVFCVEYYTMIEEGGGDWEE